MPSTPGDLVVLFDIDGTLAVSSSAHLDALAQAALAELGVAATFTMVGEKPHLNGELVSGWVDGQCFELLARQAGHRWDDVADRTLSAYAAAYLSLLEAGAEVGTLLPGVPELLERLDAAGVRMGLCTGNAAVIAQHKLTRLGIGEYFTFDESLGFGGRHPNRASVAAAAVAAAPAGARVYLVGDTTADVAAARINHVTGVGVCTGADTGRQLSDAGAHAVLADATELDGFLGLRAQRWFPRPVPGLAGAMDAWMDAGQRL